jgi:predicted ATPase/class 3 adenylate cyclase/DNA-binding CsgD family transcriptional regulator
LLPSGTVTLLLGDVEGSTRAWEAQPQGTAAAMADLNELVDELVGRFDGARPLEQGEGDSFVAAFARARDGLGCALELQHGLVGGPLRLRVGVHTGDLTRSAEGTYAGPVIIRAARLRNVAHGGQTVVSEATHDLVVDALPEGVILRDLGVHRLKDLSRPERIYQLCHPDLDDEFPPLRSLDTRPQNLPVQRTTFVGRAGEISELVALVGTERLVTLTGSGGCGKTRLGLEVAAEMLDRFSDGLWLVDLAAVPEDMGVAAKAAQAVGVLAGTTLPALDAVVAQLGAGRALVIMDNCEHVIAAAAEVVDAILTGCPGVQVLATSRQPLALEGEVTWRVPSLSLPPEESGPAGIQGLSESEAVELFLERAGRARPGFGLDDRNRDAVFDVCRRLDGIPLAIELAAARVRTLSPAQIDQGLSQRFGLLTGAARTALPRQQTLAASLDWSYRLLTEVERLAFRRLGVFPASFDLEAATAVCAGEGIEAWQVLDLISLLVDKSLVGMDDIGTAARYRLLETVRLYAADHLVQAGEQDQTHIRHRDHYLRLAAAAAPHLETEQARRWFDQLDADYPNLQAALVWSRDHRDHEQLCRMVADLAIMLEVSPRVSVGEGISWLDTALEALDDARSRLRAELLWSRAGLATAMFDYPTTARLSREASEIARQLDDDRLLGRSLTLLGGALGYSSRAASVLEEAVAACRRAGDTAMLPIALGSQAVFLLDRHPDTSRAALAEAAEVAKAQDGVIRGLVTYALGSSVLAEGRPLAAIAILEDGLRRSTDAGYAMSITTNEMTLGLAHLAAGAPESALAAADRMHELAQRTGVRRDLYEHQIRALAAAANGEHDSAALHARAALGLAGWPRFRADAVGSNTLTMCAQVALAGGQIDTARGYVRELIDITTSEGFALQAAGALLLDASIRRRYGDHVGAESAAHQALQDALGLPAWTTVVGALELLGGLAGDTNSHPEAARLFGAAEALRRSTGYRLYLGEHDTDLARTRQALGADGLQAAYDQGLAMSVNDAVAYAQRGRGERKRPTTGWDSLTPTEAHIVELVRRGQTNTQIGDQLFVSPRTVQTHLTRIYAKLDVRGRTHLAAEAANRNG